MMKLILNKWRRQYIFIRGLNQKIW